MKTSNPNALSVGLSAGEALLDRNASQSHRLESLESTDPGYWVPRRAYRRCFSGGSATPEPHVALKNALTCRDRLESAASYPARCRLSVSHFVTFFLNVNLYRLFRPYKVIDRKAVLRNCCTALVFANSLL
jgi:hypothetical protein